MPSSPKSAGNSARTLGCLAILLILVIVAGVVVLAWLRSQEQLGPLTFEERCVATADGRQVVLTHEQAYNAAIIAGVSVGRDLDPHAATIALATAYQESGLRNLEHGDRDSLGLFQQRPSQDWGTPEQIMNPWYSTNAFYDALLEVPGWETGDVNDTAQKVQKSGHPEAYRKHEDNAAVLAKVFTGQTAAGFSCFDDRVNPGQPETFVSQAQSTFGEVPSTQAGNVVTFTTESPQEAWAIASYAVANAGLQGSTLVETNNLGWQPDQRTLPKWVGPANADSQTVRLTFR